MMLDFFNEVLDLYTLYVNFLFSYKLASVPVGYILIACIALRLIVYFILHSVR